MKITKYIKEGFLIVFSVLFALLINKIAEDAKTNKYKNNALKQIKEELTVNQNILNDWIKTHQGIVENLNTLIESKSDSIQKVVEEKNYLPMQVILYEKSLIDDPLSNSAWNSAQSSGILSEFDFETLQNISQTYQLQEYIMQTSIDRIVEVYFSKSTNKENAKELLIELRSRFQNLQGQEFRLKTVYENTLSKIE